MERTKSFFILVLSVLLIQGCAGSNEPGIATSPATQGSPLAGGETQAAAIIADLAYKYGDLATNQKQLFRAQLRTDRGCSIAAEYSALVPEIDLTASVASYCFYLGSQGIAVYDCARAQEIATRLIDDVYDLDEECTGRQRQRRQNRPFNRRRERNEQIQLAREIIKAGMAYRAALGLAEPQHR